MLFSQGLKLSFLIYFLCFLLPNQIYAQGCCSGGTPLSGNLDIVTGSPRTLTFRFTYDHNNLSDIVFESRELDDKSRTRLTDATLFRTDYTFNKQFAASILLSHVRQEEIVKTPGGDNSTVGQGFGDLVFLLQYNAFQKNNTSVSIAVGFKAPTGPVNRKNESTDLLLNPDLQPGTGAWDFMGTAQFTQSDLFINFLNFRYSIIYRLTNEADRFNQQQQYEFGNELQSVIGFNYSIYAKKIQLIPQLMFRYRYTAFDQTNGIETPNTGGHWAYIIPGIETYFTPQFGFGFLAEIPISRTLTGIQLTTSYKLTGSVFYSLSFKEKIEFKKVF